MNVTDEMRAAARDAFEAQCRLAEARARHVSAYSALTAAEVEVREAKTAYALASMALDRAVERAAGLEPAPE